MRKQETKKGVKMNFKDGLIENTYCPNCGDKDNILQEKETYDYYRYITDYSTNSHLFVDGMFFYQE